MADVAAIREVIEEARPYDGDLPLFDAATALLAALDAAEARARALEAAIAALVERPAWTNAVFCQVCGWMEDDEPSHRPACPVAVLAALAGDGGAA